MIIWNPASPKPLGIRSIAAHRAVAACFWTEQVDANVASSIVQLNTNRELKIVSFATEDKCKSTPKAKKATARAKSIAVCGGEIEHVAPFNPIVEYWWWSGG
jgi:hypothetical protein